MADPVRPDPVRPGPVRYVSDHEDSGRWRDFPFREGDIVISTRSKSGTTWMQMICALLVFQTPRLPAPLSTLSPWLDWLLMPHKDVLDGLARQEHRRFIKSHTPLDGLPLDRRATYLVVARHPLDMAVSLYHQIDNLDAERISQLVGQTPQVLASPRPSLLDWLRGWIGREVDPREEMDSLPGVMWHLSDAWARRDEPNIALFHYDDLAADLDGEMRRVADLLGIGVPESIWPDLVEAATFERMSTRADELAPNPNGSLKSSRAFFRRGRSGAGREVLGRDDLDRYHARVAALAPPDLLTWTHRDPAWTHRDPTWTHRAAQAGDPTQASSTVD